MSERNANMRFSVTGALLAQIYGDGLHRDTVDALSSHDQFPYDDPSFDSSYYSDEMSYLSGLETGEDYDDETGEEADEIAEADDAGSDFGDMSFGGL